MNEIDSTETYVLVTDGIIEMTCVAHSLKEATDLFLSYLKNKNDVCNYELRRPCEIYEYEGPNLNTVHFVFTKNYIDFLRSFV